jgi:hypothetical protein
MNNDPNAFRLDLPNDRPSRRRRTGVLFVAMSFAMFMLVNTPAAKAVGNFDNAVIADNALTHPVGSYGDQCRVFVNNVVKASTGINLAYGAPNDYFKAFEENGAQRIMNVSDLRKGDIVQQGKTESSPGLHTYIIVARVSGSTYHVVDSNSDPRNAPGQVRRYDRAVTLSDSYRAYRLGKVGDVGTSYPDGTFLVSRQSGQVYRMAGGAPIYVSTWSAFGGPQPTVTVDQAQVEAMRYTPTDGTFIVGAQRGEVYRMAGGAPIYVSTWSAFGGSQPTVSVDVAAIDNAGKGGVWNHLRYTPTDGTFIRGGQSGRVYRVDIAGVVHHVTAWSAVGGPRPFTDVDQAAIDRAGTGGIWNHLAGIGSPI